MGQVPQRAAAPPHPAQPEHRPNPSSTCSATCTSTTANGKSPCSTKKTRWARPATCRPGTPPRPASRPSSPRSATASPTAPGKPIRATSWKPATWSKPTPKTKAGISHHYLWNGARRRYVPDFLIRLRNGQMLILEIKGQDSAHNKQKRQALNAWVEAVNQKGGFGVWCWGVAFEMGKTQDLLGRSD